MTLLRNLILILFLLVTGFNVSAHGDLHERILEVTQEIKISPDSAFLYFKRGKLYHQHNDFENSLKDLKKSRKLGLRNNEQSFLFAKNYFYLKKYNIGIKYASKILKDQPNNVSAQKIIGKTYFQQKKYKKAALSFEKVILNSKETFPDNYLDASKAWYALRKENGIERAQSLLIEAIEELGNNIVLYNKLIAYNVDLGDYSSAINFQKKVIDFSHRKERGYLKLAKLQILQKNYTEAIKSIELAKKYYSDLPKRIRHTKFMMAFYSELELEEEILKSKHSKRG
jgi:tetratricopeptide (TPR) repeat protein